MEKFISEMFNLTGEIAIVTGGMGQLGSEYVRTLVAAGAKAASFDISNKINSKLKEQIKKGQVSLHGGDITKKADVARMFKEVTAKFGTPTILVNNAGIDAPPNAPTSNTGPFEDYPEEIWDAVINSHLKGMFLVSQEFIRRIRRAKKKGNIINISSTYGVVTPDQSLYEFRRKNGEVFFKPVAYSVAKSGVLNFTRWLAEYGASFGVRVNTLVPGGVFAGQSEEFVKEYSKRTILGRMADAHEYNGAVLFLASNRASSYMTGAMLVADGGWTAR